MVLKRIIKNEHGRSMIEMLGVLAIVGVLSVGALAGYSATMENYKANKAIDEIHNLIVGVKDIFSDKPNYLELGNSTTGYKILTAVGIFPTDWKNVYSENMAVYQSVSGANFVVRYSLRDDRACRKILTAGWSDEFGQDLVRLYTYDGSTSIVYAWEGATKVLPMTIDKSIEACNHIKDSAIKSIYFYFK
ncbi:MAG: hypothetical protein GY804_06450 [Alphaproteobacteria bacterium]|nr:hypothetical protein [Alphaproteobacteria bacterium]